MKYNLKAYSIKEQGPRPRQEDSLFPQHGELKDSDRLFIVCDGMGGHSAGDVASSTVCQALSNSILTQCPDAEGSFNDDIFRTALSEAYDALDTKDNGAAKKMGTTMTFLKLHDGGATIAHIGDSRVYHVRPGKSAEDTEILFQTYDHSLVNDLVKVGELTPEEAKHSNQKNIITRAMQPNMERRPRADIYHTHDIKPGDYFMLCSDGILEQMEDENIKYIFSPKVKSAEEKVKMIIDVTANNHDNHTAILVHITDVIDPIPVCPPKQEVEIKNKGNFNEGDSNGMEQVKTADRHFKSPLNLLTIALMCLFLGGAVVYTFTSGDDEEEVTETQDEEPELEKLTAIKDTVTGKWGRINTKGDTVIQFNYDSIAGFDNGVALAIHTGKYGFINEQGAEVITCKYDSIGNFAEELAPVKLNGKWGFINEQGEEVITCKYDSIGNFAEELAPVKLNGKWGFINKYDSIVIECKYDKVQPFHDGIAEVTDDKGRTFSINKEGNEITEADDTGNEESVTKTVKEENAQKKDDAGSKETETKTVEKKNAQKEDDAGSKET